jgi:DNA-binding beta-propeller fold protein YncE
MVEGMVRTLIAVLAATVTTAATPDVAAKIKVGPYAAPCAAAAGGKWIWVSEYGRPYLLKIDPSTNKVVARTGIGTGSCGLGYGAGSMWIEDTNTSTVSRVSVTSGKRTNAIKVGFTPYDTTFAYGSAWTTAYAQGELERIDPARNRVVNHWKLPQATGAVGAFGSVWAAGGEGVIRVDPVSKKLLAKIPIAAGAGWTAASADAVWVTTPTGLARIDPQRNAVAATVALPGAPYLGDPDVVNGRVWVPQIRTNSIAIVDPSSNAVTQTIKAGVGPFVVTTIRGEAWVPSWKGRDIWRYAP